MDVEDLFYEEAQILSKIGNWKWDITTNKVIWSKNMFRLLGLEPYELNPSYELALHHVHNSDKKRYEEKLSLAIKNKTSYYFENTIVRKDDIVVPVISRGECILDENRNLIQMIGTVQDVSLLKELEKVKIEKYKVEELEREKMNSLLFTVIVHDIGGPLNFIHRISEELVKDVESRKNLNVLEYARFINNGSGQVLEELEKLVEWATADRNAKVFNPEFIKPHPLVQSIIKYFKSSQLKQNIAIINLIKPDSIILADKHMLIVIIRNILSNSLKYSQIGEIKIELVQETNETLISIIDDGIGIESEKLKTIFGTKEVDDRIDISNTINIGFGLETCRNLVEKHNGKIWFKSKVGHGTTCNFTLPLNKKG